MKHIEVMKQALGVLLDMSNTDTYLNEDDSIGCKVCCGVVSYHPHSSDCKTMKSIANLHKAIAEAEKESVQEPVPKVCHDLEGHIGWNPSLTELPEEGTELFTTLQQQWVGLTQEQVAQIKEDAEMIFCDTPSSTPMIVSDMIEWYNSTLTVLCEKNT
jgi:hypothetical protein